jgi:hypothetical protein
VADFWRSPGNANPPIGGGNDADQEIGIPESIWHSRCYLPHVESLEATQHVAFHLADSLPQTVLKRLDTELRGSPLRRGKLNDARGLTLRQLRDWRSQAKTIARS